MPGAAENAETSPAPQYSAHSAATASVCRIALMCFLSATGRVRKVFGGTAAAAGPVVFLGLGSQGVWRD